MRPSSATDSTNPTFLNVVPIVPVMPLYMDTHRKVKGVTKSAVADAHAKDLKVQGKYGVNYRSYSGG